MDYEYECENNEITGGIGNGDTDLQIIEVFSGSELWSNIEEKFTKENIKKLQEVGIIKQKGISPLGFEPTTLQRQSGVLPLRNSAPAKRRSGGATSSTVTRKKL